MYDHHPHVRREAARSRRNETVDQKRRRWQREQREYESRQAQRERERIAEEERRYREEEIRLASRTLEQIAADDAAEAKAQADWEAGAEQRARELQEHLARTYRRRPETFGT